MSESNLLELPFAAPPPSERGRVLVSDAFDLLRSLAPESVDLVVTDPPYESLQIHRARGTTTRLTTNWFATVPNGRLPELLREVYRVLRVFMVNRGVWDAIELAGPAVSVPARASDVDEYLTVLSEFAEIVAG